MKIVLFGGSGLLGTSLRDLDGELVTPSHSQVDIRETNSVNAYLAAEKPDIVLHAAACTHTTNIEAQPAEAIRTNIAGTANVALACLELNIRLVYLSTDYIYKGDKGNYRETDEILPFNKYAWTKLGGEASAACVPNHLIIRTSFGPSVFPFTKAFTDKWVSKDYVDILAPMILKAAKSPLLGVLNLGTDRKPVYDWAIKRNPSVTGMRRDQSAHDTPYDTSFNLQKWIEYNSDTSPCQSHVKCRICNGQRLHKYLDLGVMPLANNLANSAPAARSLPRFPLQVYFCEDCHLSQLSVVVNASQMFSYYPYRSSISRTFVEHCANMAKDVEQTGIVKPGDLAVDIAGNDGTLLNEFRRHLQICPLNVDPAGNIAAISTASGIPVLNEFWSLDVAKRLVEQNGKARIITGTNVFAHVNDMHGFLHAAAYALHDDGIILLEFPYLMDFIAQREYDTVYFEHLSYLSLTPIARLVNDCGLTIKSVTHHPIHGGSLRVIIGKMNTVTDASVAQFLAAEKASCCNSPIYYTEWAHEISRQVKGARDRLVELKRSGARIAGFAASAKGNTLLNACSISTDILDYIVDDTPEKIGRYSPGTGIPIVHRSLLEKDPPDYLVILSWNFKEEIKASLPNYKGKFIIPVPNFTVEG
jgi:hypothetical protein